MTESPQSAENQPSDDEVESKEVVEEEFLTINDYIRDVENNLTYLRSRSTSILTICGFLLPILLGIFYFIVKDSSSIHVNIHWTIIVGIICSIIILVITIYYNIKGVLVKPPDQYLSKTDRFYMLKNIEREERISFKRSTIFLGLTLFLLVITILGLYYCILIAPNSNANELINATINASLKGLSTS